MLFVMAKYLSGYPKRRRCSGSKTVAIAVALLTVLLLFGGCAADDPVEDVHEHLAAGELVEAIEILRGLLDEGRSEPEILFLYGQTLMWSGEAALAEWPLRKAMEDPEWFERAAVAVAQIEMGGRNFENAAELLAEVIERNPDNIEARLYRAKALASSPRHPVDALEEVDRILELDPDEIRAYESRILAYLTLEDEKKADEALRSLGEAIENANAGGWTPGWYCATMAIFAQDNDDEALARERWEDCNARFPGHANVVEKSIAFYDARQEYDRSLEIAQAALAADPSPTSNYRELAARYLQAANRSPEAEALLREAADSENATVSLNGNMALARFHEGRQEYAKAVGALEAGLEIHERAYGPSPELRFYLADLLIKAGQLDRALAFSETLTVEAHRAMVRARVAHLRGDFESAFELYQETSRLWPENPYAPYFAGHAALGLGRFGVALSSFRQAIRISPDATDAYVQVARLSAAHGNWRSAADVIGQMGEELGPDAVLLWLEIAGHLRGPKDVWIFIRNQVTAHPELLGKAIAAAAKGVGDEYGEEAAWAMLEPAFEMAMPEEHEIEVLSAAIRWVPEGAEQRAALQKKIDAFLADQPERAWNHALEGAWLARQGRDEEAIKSLRRARSLDPTDAEATQLLASLVAGDDPGQATSLLREVLDLDAPTIEPETFLPAIENLGDSAGSFDLLERALLAAPTEWKIADRLVELAERTGGASEATMALAQNSLRLRARDEAEGAEPNGTSDEAGNAAPTEDAAERAHPEG